MRTIGFLVNPIAGMGGRVGLKGTDDKVTEARRLGAKPRATDRAARTLSAMRATGTDISLITVSGPMGEDVARKKGFDPVVVTRPRAGSDLGETTAEDTRRAVGAFVACNVDLVVFVGGDGTAVDVAETLAGIESDIPMLGVPAGVKVYSGVFAVDPEAGGEIAATFEDCEQGDILDLDEDAFREDEVVTDLRATARVPVANRRQSPKQAGGGTVETLAEGIATELRPDVTYVFGPGSTVGAIESRLDIDGSPLGVDVYRDGELLCRDGGESDILDALGDRNEVIVSPIGGQGFVFGRGNQQISPAVLESAEVTIVASKRKLDGLGQLRVDTGDPDINGRLRRWHKVRVGKYERRLMQVV